MCTVSMIMDDWNKRWPDPNPGQIPWSPSPAITFPPTEAIKEVQELRKEIMELKELLKAAMLYDKNTGQPNCESDEKMATLRKMAAYLGVDLNDLRA